MYIVDSTYGTYIHKTKCLKTEYHPLALFIMMSYYYNQNYARVLTVS